MQHCSNHTAQSASVCSACSGVGNKPIGFCSARCLLMLGAKQISMQHLEMVWALGYSCDIFNIFAILNCLLFRAPQPLFLQLDLDLGRSISLYPHIGEHLLRSGLVKQQQLCRS